MAAETADAAVSADLPAPGEMVTVRWPNGPHDFEMEYERVDGHGVWPGWVFMTGGVESPESSAFLQKQWKEPGYKHRTSRTLHVRPVGDGTWELLPMDCGPQPPGGPP